MVTKRSLLPPLWVLTLAILGLFAWLVFELKELAILLLIGYCIAYLMDPILATLERKSVSREIGVILILVILVGAVFVLALTAVPTIVREYNSLADNFPHYVEIAKTKLAPHLGSAKELFNLDSYGEGIEQQLDAIFSKVDSSAFSGLMSKLSVMLLKGVDIAVTLVNLALLPFIIFYLAVDFRKLNNDFLAIFPLVKRKKVLEIFSEINMYVSAYARGQLTVGCVLFMLYAAGLGLIGVELWFLLAVISGFGNLVPYLGFLAGIILSTLMALVTFGDFSHVLMVWAVFAVVQFLEGTFITPKIVGDKVGLSPLVVILALVAGGTLFGLLGVFLAVPGAAVIRVMGRTLYLWWLGQAQQT